MTYGLRISSEFASIASDVSSPSQFGSAARFAFAARPATSVPVTLTSRAIEVARRCINACSDQHHHCRLGDRRRVDHRRSRGAIAGLAWLGARCDDGDEPNKFERAAS
jgi:hypothetical protein